MTIFVPELNAEVETRWDPDDHPADRTLCAQIGRILTEHYPGWSWHVDIPPRQNVILIRSIILDPSGQKGCEVRFKNGLDVNLHVCVMAGGALLERYGMRRGPFTEDQIEGKIMQLVKPQT